jgi:hypothetical protein
MADFKAHRVGGRMLPTQVYITMSNCGVRETGSVAVTECVMVEELDEAIEQLIKSLRQARNAAARILQENQRPSG